MTRTTFKQVFATAVRWLAILMSAATLIACDKPLEPLGQSAVMLAFGDSLTEGKGTNPESSYPAVLAQLSGRKVINAGISGETTAEGLLRLPDVLADSAPDLMVLMHGGNDILRNLGAAQAKANLRAMIELAIGRGMQVVLIGVPEKRLLSSSAPYYQELADEYDLVFEKGMISSLLKKPSLKSDSVHFNAAGYREIASRLYGLLKDNGAL
jgi:lysophospholipase L1-like esterase